MPPFPAGAGRRVYLPYQVLRAVSCVCHLGRLRPLTAEQMPRELCFSDDYHNDVRCYCTSSLAPVHLLRPSTPLANGWLSRRETQLRVSEAEKLFYLQYAVRWLFQSVKLVDSPLQGCRFLVPDPPSFLGGNEEFGDQIFRMSEAKAG